ncbi:phosphonate ABC transporter ATP-binding protein [Fulvimarina sp. 2208YS6-2-32]|uniref:Phosphonate ABC transporter ATP-binding protein n=1 Tax=Fulvimarina uroteuthidis TaxID=3098149 RepID=A0ABU5I527_9HYPH|nr:phosphonate ABC transporter ATP-binding protein [Fulvimarina sp. 2208YS6-2-32]MDY8109899.1 phosphonate ABC transporter ATP-binding protein [Fulvimarina sp. 2208YS6-2-32]
MYAIEVEKLSKHFGKTCALSEVDLSIARGEMVALIGASGSGKSTLMRHIAGIERGDTSKSEIRIFGDLLQKEGRLAAGARGLRGKTGVIFQQFNLVNRLPVIKNVLVGALGRVAGWRGTLGLFPKNEKILAIKALKRVGIRDIAWQRASTLSGGQQQRAAIARVLLQRSDILLADEPIASLDPASARRVMDVMADINKRDAMTILVSLHQVEYARVYCERTIAMRDGRVVYDGPSKALSNEFLTELYGSASEELVLPGELAVESKPRPESSPHRETSDKTRKELVPA